MKAFIISLALIMMVSATSYADQTIVCKDKYGHKTGSAVVKTNGSITFRDKNGQQTGTAKMSNGKTVYFDKYGHKTGECSGYLIQFPSCSSN